MVDLYSRLHVSVIAAETAGRIIRSSDPGRAIEKARSDFVTATDLACQKTIVSLINKNFPGDAVLAEEGAGPFASAADQWIVDPLDGTSNFIHGLGHSAVSIAYYAGQEVLTGVIYDPYSGEMFYAVKGSGAFLNGKRISVSGPENEMRRTLISTGMPFRRPEKRLKYFNCLSEVLSVSSGIRRMGSAALDLAYTACGRFGGFFEGWLSPWDVAAGALIVKEAGGRISDFGGEEEYLSNGCVVCGPPVIYGELLEIVRKHLEGEQ